MTTPISSSPLLFSPLLTSPHSPHLTSPHLTSPHLLASSTYPLTSPHLTTHHLTSTSPQQLVASSSGDDWKWKPDKGSLDEYNKNHGVDEATWKNVKVKLMKLKARAMKDSGIVNDAAVVVSL